MANGRLVVPPPLFTPRPYGLLGVAQDASANADTHWRAGITYQTVCPDPSGTWDECLVVTGAPITGSPEPKEANVAYDLRGATPFAVFAKLDCSPVGKWDELVPNVVDALTRTEGFQVERTFWTGVAASIDDTGPVVVYPHLADDAALIDDGVTLQTPAQVVGGPGAADAATALAALENALAQCYHGVGVIHMTSSVHDLLVAEHLLTLRSGMWFTPNGNQVAVGAGYTGSGPDGTVPDGSHWMYATGAVFYFRSDIETFNRTGSFDREVNTAEVIAERVYVVGWDCCHFGIQVSLTSIEGSDTNFNAGDIQAIAPLSSTDNGNGTATLAIEPGAEGQALITVADTVLWGNQTAEAVGAISTLEEGVAGGVATLGADGKVPASQLSIPGSFSYQGSWDAATNTPTLVDGVGTNGDLYKVSVAAVRDLGSGAISFNVGDHVVYDGATWENFGASEAVSSVAGKTGVVVLVKGDVGLGNVDNTSDLNKPISVATQAALDGKVAKVGDTMTGPLLIDQNVAAIKARLAMKLPGTQNDAPTTFGIASTYLGVGGGEWNTNSYRLIGFGYIAAAGNQYPAVIGYNETSISSNTHGDLVFGTRPGNTNVAPPIVFRIRSDGQLLAEAGAAYVPAVDGSLVTKKNLDDAVAGVSAGGNLGAPATHTTGDVNLTGTSVQVQIIDTTLGDMVVNLPGLVEGAVAGKVFTIKKVGAANGVTINAGDVSATIDGAPNIGISSEYGFRTVVFDGTLWHIIASGGS